MSTPFVGEVRLFGGNFAPVGWALCQGQLIAITSNEALFNLIGTTYGGDGQSTFGLPNLQGRVPIHQGQGTGLSNYVIGQIAGNENITLTSAQLPVHNHKLNATTTAATTHTVGPTVLPAQPTATNAKLYTTQVASPNLTVEQMSARAVGVGGGSQPHDNLMPLLVINYIIALQGVFPTQA